MSLPVPDLHKSGGSAGALGSVGEGAGAPFSPLLTPALVKPRQRTSSTTLSSAGSGSFDEGPGPGPGASRGGGLAFAPEPAAEAGPLSPLSPPSAVLSSSVGSRASGALPRARAPSLKRKPSGLDFYDIEVESGVRQSSKQRRRDRAGTSTSASASTASSSTGSATTSSSAVRIRGNSIQSPHLQPWKGGATSMTSLVKTRRAPRLPDMGTVMHRKDREAWFARNPSWVPGRPSVQVRRGDE